MRSEAQATVYRPHHGNPIQCKAYLDSWDSLEVKRSEVQSNVRVETPGDTLTDYGRTQGKAHGERSCGLKGCLLGCFSL